MENELAKMPGCPTKDFDQIINVKNAEGTPDTTAQVVVQNKIDYEPKVSVIIPVYNVELYLRICLESVLKQNLKEIEIICVDDGSTDKSLDILLEYAAKDNRITVLKQENLYAGVARNAGLAVARGEYLSFLDSDDFFEPDMHEEMYKKAKEDGSDVVVCGYWLYNQNLGEDVLVKKVDVDLLKRSPFEPAEIPYYLFKACQMTPWSKLIKHSLFTEYNLAFEKLKSCNDFTCIVTAVALANKISAIDRDCVHYRWNTGTQISSKRFGKNESWVAAVAALEQNFKRFNIYDKYYSKLRYALSSTLHWETNNQIEVLQGVAKKYLSPRLYNDLYLGVDGGPKVSVIIPVYNTELYLRECLDSVVYQTLQDIEIICVDDGSTDKSLDILREYAAKDKRLRILNQQHKKQGAARNYGLKNAKGKYVFFLDSDDFIKQETLENLYDQIERTQSEICQYLLVGYDDKTKEVETVSRKQFYKVDRNKGGTYDYRCNPQFIFEKVEPVLKLYKKDFLTDNNIEFLEGCYFEDTIVHIKCISLAKKICFKNVAYYFYRKNRDGQTTEKSGDTDKFLDIFNYIIEAEKFFKDNYMWDEIKNYYYKFAISRICAYYYKCNKITKEKFAEKAKRWYESNNLTSSKVINWEDYIKFCLATKNFIVLKSYLFFPYYFLLRLFLRRKKRQLTA
ncbi:MAG: glycosyltransferase [Alphaproteobacteria bacterium]|nr:glycosyltransferase [Alphaproteobacteria bacterium]